ncbi:MAG: hypothetical protein K2N05_02300 [Muribaculaceae bacterium]|nr:hypothetical protein [Muribaculaceae bacterium]
MMLKSFISPFLTASLISAGTIVLCGCSNENPVYDQTDFDQGIPTEVSISIEAMRSDATSISGDALVADPASEYEKIKSWWMVFVDKSGKVVKILDRTDTETGISSAAGAVEAERFKCTIPSGTYDIYAFANLDAQTLMDATKKDSQEGISFEEGKTINTSTIDSAEWSASFDGIDSSTPLPMSGFKKGVKVRNINEENFNIEVARMAAKVEFLFKNTSEDDITVNEISIDPVTSSSISLFPKGSTGISYSHLGNSAYTPLDGAKYTAKTFTFTDFSLKKGKEETKSFFIKESISGRENDKAFTIGMKVTHTNSENAGVIEYQQYNITSDILAYINRNDWIIIPVELSRYDIDVDAVFYPPIGGYPAAMSSTDPDGSQIFTFETEGDFAIVAHVTDKTTGRHLDAAHYRMELSDVTDPNSIFSVAPTLTSYSTSLPQEVTGTLGKDKKGKASLKLTVKVYDKPYYDTGAKAINTYTRKIYIIK